MASSNTNRVYEDIDPPSDCVSEDVCDTLLLYLPGFQKEQLRVQITPSRVLKISGERPTDGNKWRRFEKEFRVPANCDTREITAKFEGGLLYIRQPKVITPTAAAQQQPDDKGKAAVEAPKPQSPQPQPQPQREKGYAPSTRYAEEKEKAVKTKEEISQAPMPQPEPQPHQEAPPSDLPKLEEEEEKKGDRKDDEERKDGSGLITKRPRQVFRQSGLFRELWKPETLKRLIISIILMLGIGFYITYMFNSVTRNEQPGS